MNQKSNLEATRVLVYGTLRVDQGAYFAFDLNTQTKHLGTVRIPGTIYDLGSFPGVRLDGNEEGVVCDVLEVADGFSVDDLLKHLDRYEGYSKEYPGTSLYIRQVFDVPEFGDCFIYEINRDPSKYVRIKSGDWLKRNA